MNPKQKLKIFLAGLVAAVSLVSLYFGIVTVLSGWNFALSQFLIYWYFLISLALGFGIQISLYIYLRQLVRNRSTRISGETAAVTGTTSALAMISCCAHYLVNIAPILGIAGILSIIAQYQIKIFWVGLSFNLFGIIFIVSRIIKFKQQNQNE